MTTCTKLERTAMIIRLEKLKVVVPVVFE